MKQSVVSSPYLATYCCKVRGGPFVAKSVLFRDYSAPTVRLCELLAYSSSNTPRYPSINVAIKQSFTRKACPKGDKSQARD